MVVGGAEVSGHFLRVVEVGDGGGEMSLASEQDILGTGRQIGLVLFGQVGDGESILAEGVGVRKIRSHSNANRPDPDPMKPRCDERHIPKRGIV